MGNVPKETISKFFKGNKFDQVTENVSYCVCKREINNDVKWLKEYEESSGETVWDIDPYSGNQLLFKNKESAEKVSKSLPFAEACFVVLSLMI